MSTNPTPEQQAALDAFATGGSMVIEAGAGTGKTTTLRLLAESTTRRGLYLAFNRSIVDDAKGSFPANVKVTTAHSLAWGAIIARNRALQGRLNGSRMPHSQAAALLGVTDLKLDKDTLIPEWALARLVMDTVGRFCSSTAAEITERHVPKLEGVDPESHAFLASYIAPYARAAWADLTADRGRLSWNKMHGIYLKMWSLTKPVLKYDFILFDEAQDADPVIASIVERQTSQKIMVGDRCQAIYGWRGAVDAMSKFQADHHLVLSQSFRFGPAIAEEANAWLTKLDAPLRLTGFDKIASVVEVVLEPDAILCRTNAEAISQAMDYQAEGKRVAIVGGTGDIKSFTESAAKLMNNQRASHADLIAFKSWGEVTDYAKADEGSDLKVRVRLIENYGVDAILAVCEASVSEDKGNPDIIISTAHKAKGREWNRVKIAPDFKAPEPGSDPSTAEMMLCYVAVTRAKIALDAAALAWVHA